LGFELLELNTDYPHRLYLQVIGNFHFSPGRAYQTNQVSFQDLVPYLKDNNHHDFGHVINKFQFEGDDATADGFSGKRADDLTKSMKKRLGIVNPLDGAVVHPEECELPWPEGSM
jgi:hypothetical protein